MTMSSNTEQAQKRYTVTKADINQINRRSIFGFQLGWNYERMQGSGYLFAMLPVMRKIYGDHTPELKQMMRTENQFFNTSNYLPAKHMVECGYDLLDRQIAEYDARPKPHHDRPVVLIAPSWQEDNLLDLCGLETIRPLIAGGFHVIVRPHPEYLKRYRPRWEALCAALADQPKELLSLDQDFSSNESIYDADVIITDWSSIYLEFSFITLKPSLLINTPMRVANPDWEKLGIEPTDISLRRELGREVEVADLPGIADVAHELVDNAQHWREQIREVRERTVFNLGHGGENAGRFLLDTMLAQQAKRTGGAVATKDGEDEKGGAGEASKRDAKETTDEAR